MQFCASVRVTTPKRALGETLGAGGALGMLAGLALMEQGPRKSPRHVMVTSMGYYGNASAVVMREVSQ